MLLLIFAASISSLSAIAALLLIGQIRIERFAKPLSLIATGLLIALALSHMLPEALHEAADPHLAGLCALCGVLVLIIIEMFFNAGHSHHSHAPQALANGGLGILTGTALHTFCDGVMLAAAFAVDQGLGLAVATAIFAHELPQQLGDYALMLHCGMGRRQAFSVNLTALVCSVAGALCATLMIGQIEGLLPYVLSVAAASFIYVSLSDLLPRLKQSDNRILMAKRCAFLLLGVVLALAISHHH
ncbi:MAG: ZIP family metal transporter [Proteobacteria bacterium]|uniref:ZIP family metal transporter n=1 Tax=Candidatus Avisuccinivibrio stercorigallinarum TaxID=2840704 RepID=A0A9D9D9W4_9GAMM|nr:ZIP family metal transporter [Candidatus Avisuccinivibrio stercorigallinarum]